MTTDKQKLGNLGEKMVVKNCSCPRCKRERCLKQLPKNFKCSDIICDFCGFLAQVKTKRVGNVNIIPSRIAGAAWKPQRKRMMAGIFFSLYLVLVKKGNNNTHAIYYLPAELQQPEMFQPRNKLSQTAKRSGWQGFYYKFLESHKSLFAKLHPS